MAGSTSIAKGTGPAQVKFPNGTLLRIESAIFAPTAPKSLISFADFRKNQLHLHTALHGGAESLELVESQNNGKGQVKETFVKSNKGLYTTYIDIPQRPDCSTFSVSTQNALNTWHERLGHPGQRMLQRMAQVIPTIPLKPKTLVATTSTCMPCAIGKNQNRKKTSFSSETHKPSAMLETLVADVCGPISPPCGPFSYYMIVKDLATRYSQVHLLSSRNQVMPKLLSTIIKLRAQFPDYPIKAIRVDNAAEFVSKSFNEFCSASGIDLQSSMHMRTTLQQKTL